MFFLSSFIRFFLSQPEFYIAETLLNDNDCVTVPVLASNRNLVLSGTLSVYQVATPARLISLNFHTMLYSSHKIIIECILFCFCHV